jgi:hypothetical protein
MVGMESYDFPRKMIMSLTLKEQLSILPVPRLTTVLRVTFSLQRDGEPFEKAKKLIEDWWNEKAAPYDIGICSDTPDLSFSREGFKAESAQSDSSFALAMEEPDSSEEGRSWIVDVALKVDKGRVDFGLRHSYRQPHNATNLPEPRAPRFLRQIVDEIGAVDIWPMESVAQTIDAATIQRFMGLLESDQRTLPIIAISEDDPTGSVFTDPDKLARFLAGAAQVFRLDSNASWNLSHEWGYDWSVFRGAVRCFLPRLDRGGDKFKHRLWLPESIARLDANLRNGSTNAIVNHVFTQITAQFEAWPLLTPSIIRRQVEEISRERAQIPTQVIEVASSDAARLIGVEERTSAVTLDSVEFAEFAERASAKIKLLEELNSETIKRLERQGEVALKLENDLEQERAGRAETEKKLSETEAELKMFTEENVQLERQKAVAFGDIDRERSEALRPLWMNFTSLFSAMETVAIKFRRMEQDSDRMDGLEQDLANANQDLLNRNATIESLNRRRLNQGGEGTSVEVTFRTELAEIIPQLVKKQTSLAVILETLCIVFPDRVTVLEAAFESAKMSDTFLHVEKAFDLLWCLATTYWEQVQSNGDTVARKLFGNSYSAKEKTVLTNQGRERRTFVYCGERIQMDKHLKIGTADNASDTLRIHFEWIADEKRIVIGYCGKHLDF